MKFGTKVIHGGQQLHNASGAVIPEIALSSTYRHEIPGQPISDFNYIRHDNPTRLAYEKCMADLECGYKAFAFSSGMAAISTIFELLDFEDHIIVNNNIYGGTHRVINKVFSRLIRLQCSYVDMTNPLNIAKSIQKNTKLIWIETPTNPLLKLTDIHAVGEIAKKHHIISVLDNTFATPYIQQPLNKGIDMVVHSATKYLNGHSDVLNGVIVLPKNISLIENIKLLSGSIGAVASPFDCSMALRGLKTLSVRMKQHCENALKIAEFLEIHPKVQQVFYPGLDSHPQHDLAEKQMNNKFGGVVSFVIKGGLKQTIRFITSCRLFILASGLGGVESLIGHPFTMSHEAIPEEERIKMGITNNLIRLSVGIEDADDLIEDLSQAFEKI